MTSSCVGLIQISFFSFIFSLSLYAFAELPKNYPFWKGEDKQQYLWKEKISVTPWQPLPPIGGGGWFGLWNNLKTLGTLRVSFDHISDEMPKGRPKVVHPSGSVALVRFVASQNSPFTGVFRGNWRGNGRRGNERGSIALVRLSLAGSPQKIGSFTPGMALKFFIDGHPSVNLHVMNDLEGQGNDTNFFAKTLTNILPNPKSKVIKVVTWWLARFVRNPLHLPVDHLALRESLGNQEQNPISPYQIFFIPTSEVQMNSQSKLDFREELSKIPNESHLYRVEATLHQDAPLLHIGDIYTTSEFIASEYGDLELFFQHHE